MVDKTVRMNLLFDFYGQLLTERQRRIFEMYYAEDLSLGEIAEGSGVSRQAVYDIIKRSASSLESFEERLGLIARFERQQMRLQELLKIAADLKDCAQQLEGSDQDRTWLQTQAKRIEHVVKTIGEAEE